jgi:hypothetical protein
LHAFGVLIGAALVTHKRASMIGGTAIATAGLALLFA